MRYCSSFFACYASLREPNFLRRCYCGLPFGNVMRNILLPLFFCQHFLSLSIDLCPDNSEFVFPVGLVCIGRASRVQ